MVTTARDAFICLLREGVPLARIAALSKTCLAAARHWQQGMDIPAGAASRLIVAARVVVALKVQPTAENGRGGSDDLAAFAKRWLTRQAGDSAAPLQDSRVR
jgi:hypothetical protein